MSGQRIEKKYAAAICFILLAYWLFSSDAIPPQHTVLTSLPPNKPYFLDFTKDAGLYVKVVDDSEIFWIPGGGSCWGDYDRDGDLDVYIVGWNAQGRLFRNEGGLRFEDVTHRAGLLVEELSQKGMSCTWSDYDNSGYPSLLVTFYDSPYGSVHLFKNLGNGTFRLVTRDAGLYTSGKYAAGVAWGDVNRDGCLDLYVGYYVNLRSVRGGTIFGQGAGNQLFLNNCDGTFTESAGFFGVADYGYTFQPTFIDYDRDGFVDLFLANDFGYTRLYRNEEGRSFTSVSSSVGAEKIGQWMGVAYGDLDMDGYWDIIVTNYDDNILLKYTGSYFNDIAPRLRLTDSNQIGWGVCILDIDNNGLLDVVMANGKIGVRTDKPPNQMNKIFYNKGLTSRRTR